MNNGTSDVISQAAGEPVGTVVLLAWNSIVELLVGLGIVITIISAVWKLKVWLEASSRRAAEAVIKDNVILETNLRGKINEVSGRVESAHKCIENLEKEISNSKELMEEKHDALKEDIEEIKDTVNGNSQRITDHIMTADRENATIKLDMALLRRDMTSRSPIKSAKSTTEVSLKVEAEPSLDNE